jgi:hypothetical protein
LLDLMPCYLRNAALVLQVSATQGCGDKGYGRLTHDAPDPLCSGMQEISGKMDFWEIIC